MHSSTVAAPSRRWSIAGWARGGAFSFALFAAVANNVWAQTVVRLPDPYTNYRQALKSEQWRVEDYLRAKDFNLALISSYNDLSANMADNIETVAAWNKGLKFAIDAVDLSLKIKDITSIGLLDWNRKYILKVSVNKLIASKPAEFQAYLALVKKAYPEASSEMVADALSQAAWIAKLGFNNGLGDTGFGDPFDLYMYLDGKSVDEASAISFYDFLQDNTHGPWYNAIFLSELSKQVELRVLDGFDNYVSVGKEIPWAYIGIESAKILTDLGSARALAIDRNLNQSRLAALEFLKYYLLGYAGDRAAFEAALGKPEGTTWNLFQAFDAFIHASDHTGQIIGEGIDLPQQVEAYEFLTLFMENHSSVALKPSINPRKSAYRVSESSLASVLAVGDGINYTISVDPYLKEEGCYLKSAQEPQLAGFNKVVDRVSTLDSELHSLRVARVGDVSLKQTLELHCGHSPGRSFPLDHFFLDNIAASPGYFDLSSPPAIAASSSGYNSLSLTVTTPRLAELFKGQAGEMLDVRSKRIRYWIEEETSPGNFELVQRKFDYIADPLAPFYTTLNPTIGTSFKDDAFFVARTGSRNFRLAIEVSNTDFLVKGVGNQLNWVSQPITVRAADVQWNWTYNPVQIKVPDVASADWQADQRSLQLTADQNFTICLGATDASGWGTGYNIKLQLQPTDGSAPASVLTQQSWDAATGCAEFKATASGRYQLQHLFVDYLDAGSQRITQGLTRFGNGYVQVTGIDTPPSGGGSGSGSLTGALNDTGVDFCADDTGSYNCATVATDGGTHPRQDARFGRDAAAAAGQLTKMGGGGKGFDFSKIANNGSVLPETAALGAGPTDWACTRDNVTGLTWEVKTANATTDLRYASHGYTWYDDIHNYQGNPGEVGANNTCNNTLGGQNCNTQTYAAAVNAIALCGYTDWRLPTAKELQSIVDLGRFNPAIDPTFFPNTISWSNFSNFWTSSSSAGSADSAWCVDFRGGRVRQACYHGTGFAALVRLVRGSL